MNQYLDAAKRLHAYVVKRHWTGKAIVGPDPIGKIHWRITRFVRSYLPWLPGDDRYTYLQGQAYWIKANLLMARLTGDPRYLEFIGSCADHIVERQPDNGAWLHPPIRFRKGFVSTVEGAWAGLGLVAAYGHTRKAAHLEAAQKWYDVQVNTSGFQEVEDGLAANYYAHSTAKIPNVTTMTVWLAEELFKATGDASYREHVGGMIRFLKIAQRDSGELPYDLEHIHFMCYQYNAFQLLDLAAVYQLNNHEILKDVLMKLAEYLTTGVMDSGACRYNCFKKVPEVNYWTGALAAALRQAHELGLGDYLELSDKGYQYLLTKQRKDGGFHFSRYSYGVLTDRRSYPRYLAMILYHLLCRADFSLNR